ncbi:MAG: TonB-dependent receptor plug domain-containing protein, partial [Xanthomonadales bacterium]
MARNSKFRHTPIAAAVSAALFTCASHPVLAQDENESGMVEEVIVTGIRRSMIDNMNIKREAVGVVDAVTAEDIGKFPDTNLAESLQRIPGVSIDRQNGEGSKVTVR